MSKQLTLPGMYRTRWIHDEDGYVYDTFENVDERHQGHVVCFIEMQAYVELKAQADKLAEALNYYTEIECGDVAHMALADFAKKSKGEE